MILTTILVVVGLCVGGIGAENCGVPSNQDKCCKYPLDDSVNNANVTAPNFKCVEPIAMRCQRSNIKRIGIAGGSPKIILTVSEEQLLEKTVICSPSSAMWHLEGVPEDEFSSFRCAYMFDNGTWTFQ